MIVRHYLRIVCFFAGCTSLAQTVCTPPPKFAELEKLHKLLPSDYGNLGNQYQQARQYSCAISAFRTGLALDPASASLRYSLGISLYATGDKPAAEAAMRQALALSPNLAPAHLALGVLDHEQGKRAEALGHWQQALLLDPTLVIAIDWIAKARIEAGQYSAAADVLRAAPEDEELLLDLIVADSKAGLFDEATTRAQQALTVHPDWLRIPAALATVLVQRNRYEEAAAVLEKSRAAHQNDASLDLLYLRVLALKADTAAALPLAGKLLAQHPSDFDLLYLNGLVERQHGDYALAIPHLEAAVRINSTHYDTRYNLGFCFLKLHRLEEAREQLTKAVALDSTAPEAHFQMAAALRALSQPEAAQKELALYHERMQTRARHDRDIALSAEAAQKLETDAPAAVSLYREVTADAPEDPQVFFKLALALEQVLKLRPNDASAMNQLGLLATRQPSMQAKPGTSDAETWFRKATAASPDFAEAESNLGTLLAGSGREAEAIDHLHAALAANPRFIDAWINLAATLAATSRFAEARGAAQSALRIDLITWTRLDSFAPCQPRPLGNDPPNPDGQCPPKCPL